MTRLPLAAAIALLFSSQAAFSSLPTFSVWPGGEAPGAKNSPASESLVERSKDPSLPDRAVTGIRAPQITVYTPEKPNGIALLVTPGGSYQRVVLDKEGSDLYYRLNVFPIHLPPLRERPDDIPLLVKAFTFKIARRLGRNIDSIPAETLRLLSRMEWPGNVRELENVIERAVLLTRGSVLQLSLPEMNIEPQPLAAEVLPEEGEDEYQLIVRVLKESNGVVAGPKGAAQRLGLKRTTLLSRMKRLGIHKDQLQ